MRSMSTAFDADNAGFLARELRVPLLKISSGEVTNGPLLLAIARLGLPLFYWRYFKEFIALRRRGLSAAEAYRNISFEKEALAAEKIL